MSDLVVQPDMYSPSIDDHGNYTDKIPSSTYLQKGIYCPCGTRKDKIYNSYTCFSAHLKTKGHQKWLSTLNLNKANFYVENEILTETIQNQRLTIAKLEKELYNKIYTIDYLTQQLTNQHINHLHNHNNDNTKSVHNLLDFD
jgi:hypothetical protein